MKKLMMVGALTLLSFQASAQQPFESPDKAATALVDAIAGQDNEKLNKILGEDWQQYMPPEGADPEAVARFLRDWKVSHQIVENGDTAYLNVGTGNWQLPIPISKTEKGWHFDMAQAAEEITTREIGRNELSAIQALHAYVDAQDEYFQHFATYAQKIVSSDGKKDGLYWPTQPGEVPSPLGPAYSPTVPEMGYHGYRFRIIPTADKNGFAMIAWPVKYGETGIMSFMIDQNDKVYQADRGEQSTQKANEVIVFSPDKTWQEINQ